jgi:hypothetical protein
MTYGGGYVFSREKRVKSKVGKKSKIAVDVYLDNAD